MNGPRPQKPGRPRWRTMAGWALLGTLTVGLFTGCGGRRRAAPEAPAMTTRTAPAAPELSRTATIGAPLGRGDTAVIGATAASDDGDTVATLGLPPEQSLPPEPPASERVTDAHGFTDAAYAALLTPEETDVLRLRARGDTARPLTDHLTERERDNLRRRARESREIGRESERVGE